jgi:hypothetical protein
MLRDSLDEEPSRWEGTLGVPPTYDEITTALRAKVLWLIEHYIERVLLMIAGELESMPLLARDFNAHLAQMGRLLASDYPGLLEEADFTLRTGFDLQPPAVDINELLELKLSERRKRDYAGALFGDEPANINQPAEVRPAERRRHFPKRATWLKARLLDLGWSDADPSKWGGPDRKTVQRILDGETVGNGVLKKLADALSKPSGSEPVRASDIPAN